MCPSKINYIFKNYIYTAGHEHSKIFGQGFNWDRHDIERLMHKLILEGYLREEMVASKSDIMNVIFELALMLRSLWADL